MLCAIILLADRLVSLSVTPPSHYDIYFPPYNIRPATDTLFLDELACRGVLVSVSVRYWRAQHRLELAA